MLNALTIFFLFLLAGCNSNLMFTPSPPMSRNSIDSQNPGSAWQPEEGEIVSENYDFFDKTLNNTTTSKVIRVIDGSTIVLENGETVKYIGVKTPTIDEAFYEESKDLNLILAHNKKIKLQFDIQGRDAEGNMLAYAFVEGIFINAELLKHGYAKFTLNPTNTTFQELFIRSQEEAIQSRKGIWEYQ